jgi:hypothetical protein
LTSTGCSARNAFASPLESITPASLSSWPRRIISVLIVTSRTRTA